jgi:hypothetical protein
MDFFTWIIDSLIETAAWGFRRNDEEWSVGRIVLIIVLLIAASLLIYWLCR